MRSCGRKTLSVTLLERFVRRVPAVAATLIAALVVGGRAPVLTPAHVRAASPLLSTHAAAFPLGTAARPFGWATSVADFNRDGLPDAAVADRLPGVSGYVYQLEFSVSGLAPRSVMFESPHPSLTVNVRDVDADNDLDVVVSETLSRRVTNVWLNDGRGHFTEAARAELPRSFESVPVLANGRPDTDAAVEGALTERPVLALASASLPFRPDGRTLGPSAQYRLRRSIRGFLLVPRGPPVRPSPFA
jgi:hypothetical protein